MQIEFKYIRRGDIFIADLGDDVLGSEQVGIRPVVVIQNNIGNAKSTTVVVASLTYEGNKSKLLPTQVSIEWSEGNISKNSVAMFEQLRTLDKLRLHRYVGRLSPEKMKQVDKALSISLGLVLPINGTYNHSN